MTSDDALLRQYVAGNADVAAILTARLLPRVYAHAVRMLGDRTEAEDVAQEAMMRLWKTARDWRFGEAKITTWLYRVTANLCTDRLRRRRGVGLDEVAEPVDTAPTVDQKLQTVARHDALQWALNALPDRQRQAVVLRHIDELSNQEIGQIMGIGTRAVESLTARGKTALTNILSERRVELGYQDEAD